VDGGGGRGGGDGRGPAGPADTRAKIRKTGGKTAPLPHDKGVEFLPGAGRGPGRLDGATFSPAGPGRNVGGAPGGERWGGGRGKPSSTTAEKKGGGERGQGGGGAPAPVEGGAKKGRGGLTSLFHCTVDFRATGARRTRLGQRVPQGGGGEGGGLREVLSKKKIARRADFSWAPNFQGGTGRGHAVGGPVSPGARRLLRGGRGKCFFPVKGGLSLRFKGRWTGLRCPKGAGSGEVAGVHCFQTSSGARPGSPQGFGKGPARKGPSRPSLKGGAVWRG